MSGMRQKTKQNDVIHPTEIIYIEMKIRLVSISKEQNWSLSNNMLKGFFFHPGQKLLLS